MRIVTVPGLGGSGDQHWQTLWERESSDMHRFVPSFWEEPDFDDWSTALTRAVGDQPCVLVAHSLGCLLTTEWSRMNPRSVVGIFLVASPDPSAPAFPLEAESFGSRPRAPIEVPAILVTSNNDPYCSSQRSSVLANEWKIPSVSVGRRGHLNSESQLGNWVEGRNLLTAFNAGLAV